jgi:hypothetical protein
MVDASATDSARTRRIPDGTGAFHRMPGVGRTAGSRRGVGAMSSPADSAAGCRCGWRRGRTREVTSQGRGKVVMVSDLISSLSCTPTLAVPEAAGGLAADLAGSPDPRARRGIRHRLTVVVIAAICDVGLDRGHRRGPPRRRTAGRPARPARRRATAGRAGAASDRGPRMTAHRRTLRRPRRGMLRHHQRRNLRSVRRPPRRQIIRSVPGIHRSDRPGHPSQ